MAVLDDDVPALYPTEFAEALSKRPEGKVSIWRVVPDPADAVASAWLFRVYGKRCREDRQRESEAPSPLDATAKPPRRHAQRLHSAE